jgi:thioredoxin 1
MLSIKYVSEEWCGPCKSFWPIVQETCASSPNVSLIKVGVSHPEVKDLQISSIPTLLFYKNGQLVHQSKGVMPKHQFSSLVNLHSK